ncbi:hypothetical protein KM043_002757 [Ampulex compressa]|nr:hypothetical protein KM043_002757 [Ampulex compressa]
MARLLRAELIVHEWPINDTLREQSEPPRLPLTEARKLVSDDPSSHRGTKIEAVKLSPRGEEREEEEEEEEEVEVEKERREVKGFSQGSR